MRRRFDVSKTRLLIAKDKIQARRHQHQDRRTLFSLVHDYPRFHNTINISDPNRAVTRSMRQMTSNQCRMWKVTKMTMTLVGSLEAMDLSSTEQMTKINPLVRCLTLQTSEYCCCPMAIQIVLLYFF